MPTGGTTVNHPGGVCKLLFQSTCPRGARPAGNGWVCCHWRFQSTCPRGERLCRIGRNIPKGYFNPRAHGGTTGWYPFGDHAGVISIHVPTGGTTKKEESDDFGYPFQSTCPRGARPAGCVGNTVVHAISIHVPTGGTTRTRKGRISPGDFNPRAHGGTTEHFLNR